MARTLDPAVYTVRREAFVEAGLRLIQARGYERMSIQDVLDAVHASRGAFYHYFDSKQALLEAMVHRIADQALAALQPVVDDPLLPAIPKLERFFAGIGQWKTERKALVLEVLKIWVSDDNAVVREKSRRLMVERVAPVLDTIVEQGVAEGSFSATSPGETARVLMVLMTGFQDVATQLFLDRQARRIEMDDVERALSAYVEAFERILGAPAGSIKLTDEKILREWFG